jgi:hypothetical protein
MGEMCVCKRKSECGAPGCARGLKEDVVVREQELARRRRAWRHGQRRCDVGEAGAGQRGVGKAAARQGRARGLVQSGAEAAVHGTWPAGATAARRAEEQRSEREGRRRGTGL